MTCKRQGTFGIGCTGGNECIRHHRAAAIMDIFIVIQTKDKALTGSIGNSLCHCTIVMVVCFKNLLFFLQRNLHWQIFVNDVDLRFHKRRLIVGINQIAS